MKVRELIRLLEDEVDALMREAIVHHLEVMREHGDEIPAPTTVATAIAEVVTTK